MIAKIQKGGGFRGALNYLMRAGGDEPPGVIIGGNMAGADPRALAHEFGAARALRPEVGKPVFHASLALRPGEALDPAAWGVVGREFLKHMGIDPDRHQWTCVQHNDREHQHVHILASRISIVDGKLAREQRGDYRLSHKAAAAASRAVGLEPITPAAAHERPPALTREELAHAQRQQGGGHRHPKLRVAAALDEALAASHNLDDFQAQAARLGVEVKFAENSGGIYGVSYKLTDEREREGFSEWLKGSSVGKAYSLNSISRRLAGEIDSPAGPREGPRLRADILQKLQREKDEEREILRWGNGYIAAVATADEIRWRTGSQAESAVCAALAAERGWTEMNLADRGDAAKNQAAIAAYLKQGIAVTLNGVRYEPPKESTYEHDGRSAHDREAGGITSAPRLEPVGSPATTVTTSPPTATGAGPAVGEVDDAGQRGRGDRDENREEVEPAAGAEEDVVGQLNFLDDDSPPAPPPPPVQPAPSPAPAPALDARKEIERQLDDLMKNVDENREWWAWFNSLPKKELRSPRDEAREEAARRALALGCRHEAVAGVVGAERAHQAGRRLADPARREKIKQKAEGAGDRLAEHHRAEAERLAAKSRDWKEKPKKGSTWKR